MAHRGEDLYEQHAQGVYRYLFSLGADADTAEDLTQETFCQALKSLDTFRGDCSPQTWLCAIAKRLWLADRRKRRLDGPPDETLSAPSAEQDALAGFSRAELLRRLHALDEPLREVMYLRAFGALSFAEIGDILGKTENWARVTFYRGKQRLKKELETDET